MRNKWRRSLLALIVLPAAVVLPQRSYAQFDQQGDFLTGTGAIGGAQGWSIALSADGNTLVSGNPYDNNQQGAFWTFTRSSGVWTQQGGKAFDNNRNTSNYLPWQGYAIAISADGNTVLTGGGTYTYPGAIVFTRSNGVWSKQGSNLLGTGGIYWNNFGSCVALSGDGNTAVIGSPGDNNGTGAIWFFSRSGSTWTQSGNKIVGAGALQNTQNGNFGCGVALSSDGKTAVAAGALANGTPAAWVYTNNGGGWVQQGNPLTAPSGALNGAVALSGDGNTLAIIGSPGGVWVFSRSGGVWSATANLAPDSTVSISTNNIALSTDGNTIVASAWKNIYTCAAVAFGRSGNTWTQIGAPMVGANQTGDCTQLGISVALSSDGTTAAIGAQGGGSGGGVWPFAQGGGPYLIWDITIGVSAGASTTNATSIVYASLDQLTTGSSAAGAFSFNVANSNFDVVLDFSNGSCTAVLTGAGNVQTINNGTQKFASGSLSGSGQNCGTVSGTFTATAHNGPQDYKVTAIQSSQGSSSTFLHNGTSLPMKSNVILSDGDAISTAAGDTANYSPPDGSHFQVGGGTASAVGFQAPSIGQTLFNMLEQGLLKLLDDTACNPNNSQTNTCGVVTVCPKPQKILVGGRCGTPAKSAAIGVRGTAYSTQLSYSTLSVNVTSGSVDVSQNGVDTVVSAGNTKQFSLSVDSNFVTHDFNNDGKSDILWRDSNGNVALWTMNSAAVVSSRIIANVPSNWSIAAQRDFFGDGFTDILWRDTAGDIALWEMSGDGGNTIYGYSLGNVPATWSIAGAADFFGYGVADILWHDSSGNVAIWLMDHGMISSSVYVGNVPTSWSIVGASGRNIFWRDSSGNTALWVMSGGTVSQSISLGNVPTSWSIVGSGDFNGDGNVDILWRDSSGNVAVWLLNNDTVSSSVFVGNVPTTWSVAETGDFNGDGKSDILWRDTSGNTAVWLMNGATVASSIIVANVPTAWSIQGAGAD